MTRCRAVGNVPQDNAVEYYTKVARGVEGGLLLSEATAVSDDGIGSAMDRCFAVHLYLQTNCQINSYACVNCVLSSTKAYITLL